MIFFEHNQYTELSTELSTDQFSDDRFPERGDNFERVEWDDPEVIEAMNYCESSDDVCKKWIFRPVWNDGE